MKKRISQKALVLAYLRWGKRITQRDAIMKWACYRLASRISELRADGWNIKVTMVANKSGGRHAEYHLGRPHTFKGQRVKIIKGDGYYCRKGAEGVIVRESAVDGAYLVNFDKGWYRRGPILGGHEWWIIPAHVKFIKGDK